MIKKGLKMTIEDLAELMANYSIDTQNRFDKIDKRFDDIESELKTTRSELSLGIRELKEEIERLDARIDRLFKQHSGDINTIIEEQEKIKLRLKKLELKNSHV